MRDILVSLLVYLVMALVLAVIGLPILILLALRLSAPVTVLLCFPMEALWLVGIWRALLWAWGDFHIPSLDPYADMYDWPDWYWEDATRYNASPVLPSGDTSVMGGR
jgi:hypothetical protein